MVAILRERREKSGGIAGNHEDPGSLQIRRNWAKAKKGEEEDRTTRWGSEEDWPGRFRRGVGAGQQSVRKGGQGSRKTTPKRKKTIIRRFRSIENEKSAPYFTVSRSSLREELPGKT